MGRWLQVVIAFEHRPIHIQTRVRSTQNPFKSDQVRSGGIIMEIFFLLLFSLLLTKIRVRIPPNNICVSEMHVQYHMFYFVPHVLRGRAKNNHSPADENHTTPRNSISEDTDRHPEEDKERSKRRRRRDPSRRDTYLPTPKLSRSRTHNSYSD